MYQEVEEINYKVLASGIAVWSRARYGYFLRKDQNELDVTNEFVKELKHLPEHCLGHIDQAQHKWVDEGNEFAPNMVEFLKMLREFGNKETNMIERPKLGLGSMDYAGNWDASTKEERLVFFDKYDASTCSAATKYIAKKYYKAQGWTNEKIREVLCR